MRIQYLDNVKILGCLLVIFSHLYSMYSPQRLFIYAFHMPLFFMVSGILHKYNGTLQIRKYTRKIILPIIIYFVVFSIYHICFEYLTSTHVHQTYYYDKPDGITKWSETLIFFGDGGGKLLCIIYLYIKHNFRNLILGYDCSNVVLWFLYALFWCKIILDVKQQFFKRKISKIIFWIIISICITKRPTYFYIGQAFMAFPFYYVGYKYKAILKDFENKKYSVYIIPITVLSILITVFNGRVSMSGCTFGNHSLPISIPLFYINAFLGSIALLLLGAYIPSINIDNSAKSLITILGIQMIFVISFTKIFGDNPNTLLAILSTLVIFYMCHLLHKYIFYKIL